MAFVLPERTRERTSTTGTGDLALLGTISPNQRTFSDGVGVGNETSYVIVSGDGIGFEEGFGVLSGTTTFQRTTVTRNHLGTTAHISLSGESRVFTMIPGNLGILFAKYFGGDFSKQILRYSIVTGQWEATLDNGSWKQSCAIATTGALPVNTYANGASGVGATLTGNVNGQPTIDGIVLRLNYRVLVKDEANPIHNGIYICTVEGDASHQYQLTRAVDYDDPSDLSEGDCVAIGAAGTANGRTIWTMQTGDTGINIGTTTDINWFIVAARPSSNLDLFGSAAGDMLTRGSSNWAALAVGSNGQVLTVVSGLPAWATPAGGGGMSLDNDGNWNLGNSYTIGKVVRDGADFFAAKNVISASPTSAPDLDGHAIISSTGASATSAITTTVTNDLIFLLFATKDAGGHITSVTSSLTFTKIFSQTSGSYELELWSAPSSAILTAESITATLSASINYVMHLFAVKAQNQLVPLDINSSLPKYSSSGSSISGISTSSQYDILFYFDMTDNPVGFNQSLSPSGFTHIDGSSYLPAQSSLSYQRVTALQTNITLDAANGPANQTFVFAVTSGNAAPHADATNWVRLSGFDETAFNTIFGTSRGSIPAKGAATWGIVSPGTAGQILNVGSAGDPAFVGFSAALDAASFSTPGAIMQRGTAGWGVISPGTSGQILTMGTAGISAAFANAAGGGGGSGSGLWAAAILSGVPTQAGTGLSTWLNQGSATVTNGETGIRLDLPTSSSDQVRGIFKSVPATPYKLKFLVSMQAGILQGIGHGVGWYDGTNKLSLIFFDIDGSGVPGIPGIIVLNFSNPTTFNAILFNGAGKFLGLFPPLWFHIEDDGTNIKFGWSTDGGKAPFILYSTAKSTGYLGASGYSNFGFFANTHNSNVAAATLMALESYT